MAIASNKKKSPLKAIREFCMECQGNYSAAVAECVYDECQFYSYREGKALAEGRHRPTGAIKDYCLQNCQGGGNSHEVKSCGGKACPVYPFRNGRNANITPASCQKRSKTAQENNFSAHLRPIAHIEAPDVLFPTTMT